MTVVNEEQWKPEPEDRFVFLRFTTMDGEVRAKRLIIRDKGKGIGARSGDVIGKHEKSRLLKSQCRNRIILELNRPEDLEPLIEQAFESLEASTNERSWYWEKETVS